MPEFTFPCPLCGQSIQCDTRLEGKQIDCPVCHRAVLASASPGAAPAAPPPAPAAPRTPSQVWVITAVFLALAALVAGGWFVFAKVKPRPVAVGGNLIGWWKLDDGAGTTAKDSAPGRPGHDGTLEGGPKWVPGRTGGALQFDGGQHVALGAVLEDGYPELTIACWVKHPRSSWENIVERGVWDQADGIGLLMDYNETSVSFGHYGALGAVQSKTTVQDDQWHHVAGTLHRAGLGYVYSIYVDGRLDNTATHPDGFTPSTLGWAIGSRHDGSWGYHGLIADVRIYDRALSPAEIQTIYQGH